MCVEFDFIKFKKKVRKYILLFLYNVVFILIYEIILLWLYIKSEWNVCYLIIGFLVVNFILCYL